MAMMMSYLMIINIIQCKIALHMSHDKRVEGLSIHLTLSSWMYDDFVRFIKMKKTATLKDY